MGPGAWSAGGGGGPVEDRRPRLLQRLLDGEGELGDLREAAQAGQLRGQLEILRDEPLILALEEETDLPERLDVAFFRERHHVAAHLIITGDPTQAKSASGRGA